MIIFITPMRLDVSSWAGGCHAVNFEYLLMHFEVELTGIDIGVWHGSHLGHKWRCR